MGELVRLKDVMLLKLAMNAPLVFPDANESSESGHSKGGNQQGIKTFLLSVSMYENTSPG